MPLGIVLPLRSVGCAATQRGLLGWFDIQHCTHIHSRGGSRVIEQDRYQLAYLLIKYLIQRILMIIESHLRDDLRIYT